MTRDAEPNKKWIRVNGQRPCPVCAKAKGCLVSSDGSMAVCLRIGSDHEAGWGLGGFYHRLSEQLPVSASPVVFVLGVRRRAEITVLNRVYDELLSQHDLSVEHREHLLGPRGLSPEAVDARKYRSWGRFRSLRWQIAKAAYARFGSDALDVPGVIVRKQGERDEYVTLAGAPGIAIPIQDAHSRICGMQIRVENPKPGAGKYAWLSSASQGGATCGTPVHVARPLTGKEKEKKSTRVWLTEGALKADIACDRLDEIVIAVPGVNAIHDFVPTLDALMERGELKELVIALDSDWRDNPRVKRARFLLAERAARVGVVVWLADWSPKHKGLDDLLLTGGRPTLEPYRVQGNGPRQILSVPRGQRKRPSVGRALPLEQARIEQERQLKAFLNSGKELGENRGLLMRAKPGLGKSTALTAALNQYVGKRSRKRALLFVPRYELSEGKGRENWQVVRGRTHESSALVTPCSQRGVQGQLAHLRIPGHLGCEACPALELCKTNLTRTEGQPFYHAQFEEKARVAVHPAQHFMMSELVRKAAVVVLDDCDLRSLAIEDISVSRLNIENALAWARKHPEHAYVKAQKLLEVLVKVCSEADIESFSWAEIPLLSRLEHMAGAKFGRDFGAILREALECHEPDPFVGGFQVASDLPMRFVKDLAEVLHWEYEQYLQREQQEWQGWNSRVRLRRIGQLDVEINLKKRRDLPLQALQGRDLVIIDASLTLEEAQQLFPDREWQVVDPPVEMPSSVKIIQYPEQNWGKRRLSSDTARLQALEKIREVVNRHPGQSISVITHLCFVGDVRRAFPHLKVGHFYGQRGSNQFQDCDVEIIFGTPYPNSDELQQQAEALFWDQDRVLRQVLLEPQCLGVLNDEEQWVPVRTHADQRLKELHRSKCQEEMIQAIYRIRPLSVEEGRLIPSGPDKRSEATVYVFSAQPLPQLDVELVRPDVIRAPVTDLMEAATRIASRRELVTEERLRVEGQVTQWKARQFLSQVLRSRLGQGPPPAQGPPAALAG
jgi:hypothetical protein